MEGLGGPPGTYRPVDSDADVPANEEPSERQSNRFSLSRLKRHFPSRKEKKYELAQIPMREPKEQDTGGLGGTPGAYRPIDPDADAPADEDESDRPSNRFSLSKLKQQFHLRKKKESYELPHSRPLSRPKQEETEQTPVYEDDYHLEDERYKQMEQDHFEYLESIGFTVDERIGFGKFGNVYRVRQFVGEGVEREMACKVVSLGMFSHLSYSDAVKAMKKEDRFFRQLKHVHIIERLNVIRLYDHKTPFPEAIHFLHFMEVMEKDLFALIHNWHTKRLTEEETRDWLAQVVSAVAYLHERNICHLDIKPDNILYQTKVNRRGEERKLFKLSDFGNAIHFANEHCVLDSADQDQWMGSWHYTAPELVRHPNVLAKPLDIYALGISVCLSLTGHLFDDKELIAAAKESNREYLDVVGISEALAQLIIKLISHSPLERPSIESLAEFLGYRGRGQTTRL